MKPPVDTSSNDQLGRVVRVSFGDGGGRKTPGPFTEEEVSQAARERDIFGQSFSVREVSRMTGLSAVRLKKIREEGIVRGAETDAVRYTFSDLIALRVVAGLLAGNIRTDRIKRAVRALAETLPDVQFPLQELHVSSDGKQIVVRSDKVPFEPVSGQLLLDFSVDGLQADIARLCRPVSARDRQRMAQERYLEATELDENPATWARAEALYEEALSLSPNFAIALTNLGNLYFRQARAEEAKQLYLRALEVEPHQAEAHYNLGYLAMDRGDLQVAVRHFETSLRADERFADAHFNLGLVHEALGDMQRARRHWERYVELEPRGPWAELARANARRARL